MKMQIEYWPIEKVLPYDNNPRIITKDAVKSLADLIAKVGFRKPIEVDEGGVILVGHRRRLAALSLGLKRVPVIQHTDLSEEEKLAYRVADNKIAEETDWNRELLSTELGTLSTFSADLLGFDDKEITKLFDLDRGADAPADAPLTEQAQYEPEPICKPGSVWVVNGHQIVAGDDGKGCDLLIETLQKKFKTSAVTPDGDSYADLKLRRGL